LRANVPADTCVSLPVVSAIREAWAGCVAADVRQRTLEETLLVPLDGELIPITDLPLGTDTITTSDERRPAGGDEELAKCLAAVNAALVFRRLHEEAWHIQLMPESAFLPPTAANAVIAGILALAGLGLLTSTLILNPTAAILTWLLLGSITQARCTSISL
jgi:hypothetical protein